MKKKIAGDIIIVHMCTKNHNRMRQFLRYGVRQNFFVILGHFLPFIPPPTPNNLKNQNFEKMKEASLDHL